MAKSGSTKQPARATTAPRRLADITDITDITDISLRVKSPDKRLTAIVFDAREYAMGWWDARLVLVDASGAVVEDFGGLFIETASKPAWSADSKWLAFPTRTNGADGAAPFVYLAWHVARNRFGVVPVTNPYPLSVGFVAPGTLRLRISPSQVEAANVREVFGGGISEAPVRRFRADRPVEIALRSLAMHAQEEIPSLAQLAAKEPPIDLALRPAGFHPYRGPGLKSSTQRINGRPLEGHHLEDFAEWGDEVAKAWLAEVRDRMKKRYDRWAPVGSILGARKR